ncbi:Gfo/Idh/MocA family oxidoreductase [Pseudarthrobacter sp. J64]|uniref:Gfo/Idh/MocA family protein n=1 Tax=Pseudarthrobacter sp. J64 TaxID=3116485 RepID=UPI002E81F9DF|nr:Gfo/Idh/MocA family oxidoreductase [Pseudarthrobacter sp. J64]MEE2570354.1 Gfo/Idh/MocA family oxidoreductase [Pseudarthrobacter sp. J64]
MTGKTIRTAVLGYGLSGRVFHAPLIASDPQYSLDVIATSDAPRADAASSRYPGVRVVPDAEAALALADSLDLVVLGTPPATHYPIAKAALEAGLDVVVDKPFAVSSAQGEELVALAERLGRVLTVYQNRRWDNGFLTVKKLLDAGALGEVLRFEAAMERWAPEITKPWKAAATAEDGGGILFDLGTHLLDMAVQLFGPAEVVHAEINARRTQEQADDDNFVVLRHQSVDGRAPVTSHLTMNVLSAAPGPDLRILGTKAGYVKRGIDPQEQQLDAGMMPGDPGYGVEPGESAGLLGVLADVEPVPTEPGAYQEFYRILGEKLLDGGTSSALPLPVDPRGPVAVLRLIEQARALAGR